MDVSELCAAETFQNLMVAFFLDMILHWSPVSSSSWGLSQAQQKIEGKKYEIDERGIRTTRRGDCMLEQGYSLLQLTQKEMIR